MATINDLVLVHVDNRPGFYARLEEIVPDVKPGWWQVKLLVLSFPLQVYTWILDEQQIGGASFTMGGTPLRLERVQSPLQQDGQGAKPVGGEQKEAAGNRPKVVSLADRKKDKE